MKRRVLTVAAASTLEALLGQALDLPPEALRALVERGAVYRQGRRCRELRASLQPGEAITVVLEEGGKTALSPSANATLRQPQVLLEDDWLLAVDKPAGWPAQPTPSGGEQSLLDWASAHLGRAAGLVHRLDRGTSGVTVFGKTQEATSALAGAFREGTARKRYLAACGPSLPDEGIVDLPLSKDPSRPGRYRASRQANGVPALTRYRRLHQAQDFCLVALFPESGRTHQLRAHLAALGAPILGDEKYGGAKDAAGLRMERSLLHAHRLELPHPGGSLLRVVAPVPADLAELFERAGCAVPADDA